MRLSQQLESAMRDRIGAWLDSLGDPITIYRALYVQDVDSIRWNKLGIHWTAEKGQAHSPFGYLDNAKGEEHILKARVKRSEVNTSGTITTMQRYPMEREIRLKSGAKFKVLSVTLPGGKELTVGKMGNAG